MQLEGFERRVAVVTGAAQGIGSRICETLVAQGAAVAGLDLNQPALPGVLGLAADVTDPDSVDAAFGAVEEQLGAPVILVLNAGVFIVEPFAETSAANWRRTLDVNLTGAFHCAQRALPGMVAAGYGRLVTIGSSAGITGGASSCAAYAASKAGAMCLAKSIANEYARHGITSNALAPALIDTAMMAEQPAGVEQRIPVGRLGTAQEVADLVAYLASGHAGFVTGEVVDINGGFLVD
ncbi:MAG TPA: SDR family NAD(P)-dependent oxidoreductase [Conexibacter sp.]|nr:SDR family NAD(P)-dependent oxidoreductase [Conexibacter sp.]